MAGKGKKENNSIANALEKQASRAEEQRLKEKRRTDQVNQERQAKDKGLELDILKGMKQLRIIHKKLMELGINTPAGGDAFNEYTVKRDLINTDINSLSDLSSAVRKEYAREIQGLNGQINTVRFKENKRQSEEQVKLKILKVTKTIKKQVDSAPLVEVVGALVAQNAKSALTKLINQSPEQMKAALLENGTMNSLVEYVAMPQDVVLALKDLTPEQQEELVLAVFSGDDANVVLETLTPEQKITVTLAVIQRLADTSTKLTKKEKDAVDASVRAIHSGAMKVANGEAQHLSIVAALPNGDIVQLHTDINRLADPEALAADLAEQFVALGIDKDTPTRSFLTSDSQVGLLQQLPTNLRISDEDPLSLVARVIDDPNQLVSLNRKANINPQHLVKLGKATASTHEAPLLTKEDVIRGLAVVNATLLGTALNPKFLKDNEGAIHVIRTEQIDVSKEHVDEEGHDEIHEEGHGETHEEEHGETHEEGHGETHEEGHGETHEEGHGETHEEGHGETHEEGHGETHEEGHGETHEEGHGETHEEGLEFTNASGERDVDPEIIFEMDSNNGDELPLEDTSTEMRSPYGYEDMSYDHSSNPEKTVKKVRFREPGIINNIESAIEKLNNLDTNLSKKYGKYAAITNTNRNLIEHIKGALKQYEKDGDIAELERSCRTAIHDVKEVFNTHRDNSVRKFLGDIVSAFTKLINTTFAKSQEKMLGFFNEKSGRVTKSAEVLYTFNEDINKAFEGLTGEPLTSGSDYSSGYDSTSYQ